VSIFVPDLYYERVSSISSDVLREHGIRGLMVDLDNTIMFRDSHEIPADVRVWLSSLRMDDIRVCIVSNNWHAKVESIAEELDVPLVAKALKPFPRAFRAGMQAIGTVVPETAMVGDQIFTDIVGAAMLGVTTILVHPLSSSDPPHTLLLRRIEAKIMANRAPLS